MNQSGDNTENNILESTRDAIFKLRGGLCKSMTVEEIQEYIKSNIFAPRSILSISIEILNQGILRGRFVKSNDEEHRLNNIGDLVAPPFDNISLGRCTKAKSQNRIFYGSLNLPTVYNEIRLDVGDYVQIIDAERIMVSCNNENKPAHEIKAYWVGLIDHIRRFKHLPIPLITNHDPKKDKKLIGIKGKLNELKNTELTRQQLFDAFIADEFSKVSKTRLDYKITAAFSEILFARGSDAIVYPSVQHHGGYNIAMKQECFDDNFTIKESKIMQVEKSFGWGIYDVSEQIASKSIDEETGEITWKKCSH